MDGGGVIEIPLVLQRILSFLATKEAAKASLLSKAWQEAWRTRPSLDFDENLFLASESADANLSAQDRERAQRERARRFSRYINTTMRSYSDRNIRIDTLKLKPVSGVISTSVIRESIRIAVENNVRDLVLHMSLSDDSALDEIFFRGKSIVHLGLRECNLRTLSVHQIRCRNIRTLSFVLVSMDELMFENIIHGCPLLKVLKIWRIDGGVEGGGGGEEEDEDSDGDGKGFHVFRVKKHANLRQIHVEFLRYQSLILGELPRLESLVCDTPVQHLWREDDDWMPSGLSLSSSHPYQNMNSLDLDAVGIGDNFFDHFANMFPNVEDLSIDSCKNLQTVKL